MNPLGSLACFCTRETSVQSPGPKERPTDQGEKSAGGINHSWAGGCHGNCSSVSPCLGQGRILSKKEEQLLMQIPPTASPLPLTTQLSRDDEKVIKCISEILADTLSRPRPIPATKQCVNILREDERVLAMLHHWHLLTELEDLTHQENAKHRLGSEDNHDLGRKGKEAQGELKKRDQPTQDKDAASGKEEEHTEERRKEEEQEGEEYEEMESTKETVNVSQGEDLLETLEDQKEEEEEIRKKESSSETWSSKEYFGLEEDHGGQKSHGMVKKPLRLDEEEGGGSSEEEEPKKDHREGLSKGHHHETWEGERKRSSMAKRVAEKASDEETAQFEEEEEGGKISSPKENLHRGWKPQQKEAEEEESKSHGRPDIPVGLDFKERHWKDEVYLMGGHQASDEEEEGRETGLRKGQELEEIERQVRWAAAKLEELKRV